MEGSDSGSAKSDDRDSLAMDTESDSTASSSIPSSSRSSPRRSRRYAVTIEDVTDEEVMDAQTMEDTYEPSERDTENSSSSDESDHSNQTASDDFYTDYDPELDVDEPDPSIEELIVELERHLGPQAEEELWKISKYHHYDTVINTRSTQHQETTF